MNPKLARWIRGLLGAFIHGASSAALAWGGLSAAHGAGMDVPSLHWKGLGIILISGGLPRLFSFLNDHPLPDADTEILKKDANEAHPV